MTQLELYLSTKEYYLELYENFQKARHSIFILGWDVHSEVDLAPHLKNPDYPTKLHQLLIRLAKENKDLNIYILPWEYILFYITEREILLAAKLDWLSPSNIHLRWDGYNPIASSQHQKIVVIDDSVAYCGGLDLTMSRWDDQELEVHNKLRLDSHQRSYPPFHDIQIRCEKQNAFSFAKLVRERWKLVTNKEIPFLESISFNKNIIDNRRGMTLHVKNQVMLQTRPVNIDGKLKNEIEDCYRSLFEHAQKSIYIENQYLTSSLVIESIVNCLNKEDGPEIVIVLPKFSGDWLEQETMGRLQYFSLLKLKEVKNFQKLRIVFPDDKELEGKDYIVVHSKIILVDDRHLLVGSANLTNRSMRMDSEVAIYAEGNFEKLFPCFLGTIARFKKDELEKIYKDNQSYIECVDYILEKATDNQLRQFDIDKKQHKLDSKLMANEKIFDQKSPFPEELEINQYVKEYKKHWSLLKKISHNWGLLLTFVAVGSIVLTWYTIGREPYAQQFLSSLLGYIRNSSLVIIYICLIYAIAGFVFTPINILILLTVPFFEPMKAYLYVMLGTQCYCLTTYLEGWILQKYKNKKGQVRSSKKLKSRLKKNSLLSLILIRILPVAPSFIIGLGAGYYQVSLGKYLLGSAIGIAPGSIILIFFQKSVFNIIEDASVSNVVVFIALLFLIAASYKIVKRRYRYY